MRARRDTEVNLGVDLGSIGIRAAYAHPDGVARPVTPAGAPWPSLRCAPAPDSVLGVRFPSAKCLLGRVPEPAARAPDEDRAAPPRQAVTRVLRHVRARVEEAAGAPVGQTVISVPVRYRSAQRAALRDAARAAGLARVRLVNDSSAAVIGHLTGQSTATCLVYAMGYSGFEVALVRAAHTGYRVLGCETGEGSCGRVFDETLLSRVVALLRDHPGATAEVPVDEAGWHRLRLRAQRARERLTSASGDAGALLASHVWVPRQGFDAYLDRHVSHTLERADLLLQEAGLSRAAVDVLLLVGGCTRMPGVRDRVRRWFGREYVTAAPDLLARGALLVAHRLGGRRLQVTEGAVAVRNDDVEEAPSDLPAPAATLLRDQDARLDLREARRLMTEGRVEEARALLERIVAGARELLDRLPDRPPPSPAASSTPAPPGSSSVAPSPSAASPSEPASRHMARARRLLAARRYEQAVRAAHTAWRHTTTPELFDAMIDVHCSAAMADTAPESFPAADRWLRCAYHHDPTNARVRSLLARRTYLHAAELHRRGRRGEAVEALHQCLTWEPDHAQAHGLLRRLLPGAHRPGAPEAGAE